jgi:uncharacterized protein (DUF433 family)
LKQELKIENRPVLGKGIYTIPDIAMLLGIPTTKARRWISEFWDDRLGKEYQSQYSWNIDFNRAVNFHTLIEIYTFYHLSKSAISPAQLLEAHKILSKRYKTPYPFASKHIIERVKVVGKKVVFDDGDVVFTLDKKLQLHFTFIRQFFEKLDFGKDDLAVRFWPLGRKHEIVCDPQRQFGQPVINGTNILAETVKRLYDGGDSKELIARIYDISPKQVDDAITYGSKAA